MCGRDFVNPVDWEPAGSEHWGLLLRCGECETWREVTVTNAVARRYDAELNRRADIVAASLERLDRERMIVEAEAMTIALRLCLIDAADFATARKGGGQRSG
jgi:predicted aminopeptidase